MPVPPLRGLVARTEHRLDLTTREAVQTLVGDEIIDHAQARWLKSICIKGPISPPGRIEFCTVSVILSARDEQKVGSREYIQKRRYAHNDSKHPNQTLLEGVSHRIARQDRCSPAMINS
jgi:hypothetical protein